MSEEKKINIVLADDHDLVRQGIRSLLEGFSEIKVLAEAADGNDALEKVAQYQPDILICDIRMPNLNGIQAVAKLSQSNSTTKALMLSMHDSEEYVIQSIEAGAYGYLLKDTDRDEFLKAIKTIYKGDKYFSVDISAILVNSLLQKSKPIPSNSMPTHPKEASNNSNNLTTEDIKLTKRQKEILQLAVKGMSNKEIAEHLGKSIRTIEAHRFTMMKKLNVKNILELSNKARKYGLIE